jgi:hypothetical protein
VTGAGIALPRELRLRVALLWQFPRLAVDLRLTLPRLVGEPLRPVAGATAPARRSSMLLEVIADDMRARGTGTLLITHDRQLAEHWCDRIVELARASDTAS